MWEAAKGLFAYELNVGSRVLEVKAKRTKTESVLTATGSNKRVERSRESEFDLLRASYPSRPAHPQR